MARNLSMVRAGRVSHFKWEGFSDPASANCLLLGYCNFCVNLVHPNSSTVLRTPVSGRQKRGYDIDGRRYMRKSRFTDEQILAILQQAEAERNIRSVCQANGISEQTFYRWKAKYRTARMQGDRRLRSLEDENRRLRELVVEQSLDIQALRAALERGGSEAQPDEP
jgi:putative transposase